MKITNISNISNFISNIKINRKIVTWLVFLLMFTTAFLPFPLSNEQTKQLLIHQTSSHLNQIITLQKATIHLLPTPQMRIHRLQLILHNQELASAENILLPIDGLQWLLGGETPITEIRMEQLKIQPALLLTTINEFNKISQSNWPPIHVTHTSINTFTNDSHANLALTITTDSENVTQIKFQQATNIITIKPKRAGRAVLLEIATSKWQLNSKDQSTAIQLTGTARITDTELELDQLHVNLDNGQIRGALRFSHAQTWNVAGSLKLEQIPIHILLNSINLPILYGATTGTLYLDSTGHNLAELIYNAAISGQLTINTGKFVGLDLTTPLYNLNVDNVTNKDTNFTNLHLELERQNYGEWLATINSLQINKLQGSGLIRINEGMLLDGIIKLHPKENKSKTIPLLISGTITQALVRIP